MLNQNRNSDEQRNLLLALALTAVVFFVWQTFFGPKPQPAPEPGTEIAGEAAPAAANGQGDAFETTVVTPTEGGATIVSTGVVAYGENGEGRAAALDATPRVIIDDPLIEGSINLVGGLLDDVTFTQFHETIDKTSPNVQLLQPSNLDNAYFVEMGWQRRAGTVETPNAKHLWTADTTSLSRGNPVTLSLSLDGLTYQRRFEMIDDYLIQVTESVTNASGASQTLRPYLRNKRVGKVETLGNWLIHEGAIGYAEDRLHEYDYKSFEGADGLTESLPSTGGWIGFTDKFWLSSVMPLDQDAPVSIVNQGRVVNNVQEYSSGYSYGDFLLDPGASAEVSSLVFAGPKQVTRLDDYSEQFGLKQFDKAIDYGWFYYLTKPFAKALIILENWSGNFGIALILLTIAVKIIFFPLAWRSYVSMAAMRRLAPRIAEIRQKYPEDRAKVSQETMELYKKEGANPVAGCLPMLLQIPVFFALYKTLFVTIEMRHAPFYGWLTDLSAPDPTTIFNLFGLLPYTVPDLGLLNILSIGLLPLIMGVSMWAQQKLNPPPADPQQAMIFNLLPIVFTFMLASFPAGLVLYWTANNILTLGQQWTIMRYADAHKRAEREARRKPKGKGKGKKGDGSDGQDDTSAIEADGEETAAAEASEAPSVEEAQVAAEASREEASGEASTGGTSSGDTITGDEPAKGKATVSSAASPKQRRSGGSRKGKGRKR